MSCCRFGRFLFSPELELFRQIHQKQPHCCSCWNLYPSPPPPFALSTTSSWATPFLWPSCPSASSSCASWQGAARSGCPSPPPCGWVEKVDSLNCQPFFIHALTISFLGRIFYQGVSNFKRGIREEKVCFIPWRPLGNLGCTLITYSQPLISLTVLTQGDPGKIIYEFTFYLHWQPIWN